MKRIRSILTIRETEMDEQANHEETSHDDLDIKDAELEDSPEGPLACTSCHQPIEFSYYKINGNPTCDRCHAGLIEALTGGSRMGRFVRALLFGIIAAGVGAGIYFAIAALTGYEFALVALVVGLMVGGAVRWGSNARGGWFYQLLAMFLTYSAIVTTYIPYIVKGFVEEFGQEQLTTSAPATVPSESTATSSAPASLASEQQVYEQDDVGSPGKTSQGQKEADLDELGGAGILLAFLVAGIILFVLAFIAPFLAGEPIGLLIIGVALYEAWQLNKRAKLEVEGPIPVSADIPGNH